MKAKLIFMLLAAAGAALALAIATMTDLDSYAALYWGEMTIPPHLECD